MRIRSSHEVVSVDRKSVSVVRSDGPPIGPQDTDGIFQTIMKENGYPTYQELSSKILKIEQRQEAKCDLFYLIIAKIEIAKKENIIIFAYNCKDKADFFDPFRISHWSAGWYLRDADNQQTWLDLLRTLYFDPESKEIDFKSNMEVNPNLAFHFSEISFTTHNSYNEFDTNMRDLEKLAKSSHSNPWSSENPQPSILKPNTLTPQTQNPIPSPPLPTHLQSHPNFNIISNIESQMDTIKGKNSTSIIKNTAPIKCKNDSDCFDSIGTHIPHINTLHPNFKLEE